MRLSELHRGSGLVRLRGIAMLFGGILMLVSVRIVGLQCGLLVCGCGPQVGALGVAVMFGRRSVRGKGALQ